MTISVMGCGWLGLPLAEALVKDGFKVRGSTTREDKIDLLSKEGIDAHVVDLSRGEIPAIFLNTDSLIINVPPRSRHQSTDLYLSQMQFLNTRLSSASVKEVVFVSSTSVYGNKRGKVVEGDADPESYLRKAELLFLENPAFTTNVIRFAGLVGPGRHPGRFLSGKQVSDGEAPVNLIHLDDCIAILKKVIATGRRELVLNACCDEHPTKAQFYTRAAVSAGLPAPLFTEHQGADGKVIDNALLKDVLAYEFLYPDPIGMLKNWV